jgi:hypothetical protein
MPTAEDPAGRERGYRDLIARMRACAEILLPEGARVLVVSHGDDALLRLGARQTGHFPQSSTGLYAGHHPADGAAAAAHLGELRRRGFDYLVVPATSLWWLDYYEELAEALAEGELVCDEPQTCLIYSLRSARSEAERLDPAELAAARGASQVRDLLAALLPDRAGVVLVGPGAGGVGSGERPLWHIEDTPEHTWSPPDARRELDGARAEGARYVVVMKPADPRAWPDSRLTRAVTEGARRIFSQRLADGFELASVGGPEAEER